MSHKILILGANGFVGKNIYEIFSKENNFELKTHQGRSDCNLLNLDATKEYFKSIQPDVIINCAAVVGSLNYVSRLAADVIFQNSIILLNLYEALKSLNKKVQIIHPIANCAFPATNTTFEEDKWLDGPLHPSVMSYGFTRRMIWHVGECYKLQHQIQSIYFFVPNMYGAYDSTNPDKAHALDALISKFVKADKSNQKTITVWGTGIAVREWLYAPDFARLILMYLKSNSTIPISEPINVAQNFGLSVRDIVNLINQHFNYKFDIRFDDTMPDGAPRKVMSDIRFKKYFPNFEFTELDKGIEETIKYYQSIYPY